MKDDKPMPFKDVKRHMEVIGIRQDVLPGCIVTLKSGGPAMTVDDMTSEKAHCLWHEDAGELCSFWFPLHCLMVKK